MGVNWRANGVADNPATKKFAEVFMRRRAEVKNVSDSESEEDIPMPIRVAKAASESESDQDDTDGFVVDDDDELELEKMEDAMTGHAHASGWDKANNAAFAESHGHAKRLKRERFVAFDSDSEDEACDSDQELMKLGKRELLAKRTRVVSESASEEERVPIGKLMSEPVEPRPFAQFQTSVGSLQRVPMPSFQPPKHAFSKPKSSLASLDSSRVAGLVNTFHTMQKQESRSGLDAAFVAKSDSQTAWGKASKSQPKDKEGGIGFKGMLNK